MMARICTEAFLPASGTSLNFSVFDPFMGSGTTLGEAHKLGLTALGRDINPVAVESVRVALGRLQAAPLEETFTELDRTVGVAHSLALPDRVFAKSSRTGFVLLLGHAGHVSGLP